MLKDDSMKTSTFSVLLMRPMIFSLLTKVLICGWVKGQGNWTLKIKKIEGAQYFYIKYHLHFLCNIGLS